MPPWWGILGVVAAAEIGVRPVVKLQPAIVFAGR